MISASCPFPYDQVENGFPCAWIGAKWEKGTPVAPHFPAHLEPTKKKAKTAMIRA